MAITSLITSLLSALAGTPSGSSSSGSVGGGGMWSSYMPQQQQQQQSLLGSMLDVKGRAMNARSGSTTDKGSFLADTFMGGGLGLFSTGGKKSSTYTFDPYSTYSSTQLPSVYALESLASSGTGGGINLGKAYQEALGNYDVTEGEKSSLSALQQLLTGGDISGAREVYSRMASNKFNPDDPSSGYAAYSRQLAKAQKESGDVLNREAAITGSRFGTGIQKQKADLASDYADQRASYLADLYNQSENRALQGASGLQSLIPQQQSLLNQIATQAAIERQLKNQEAEDKYAEFIRQQQEQYMRIGLMQDQKNVPMGKITYTM